MSRFGLRLGVERRVKVKAVKGGGSDSWLINRQRGRGRKESGPSLTVTARLKGSFLQQQDPRSHAHASRVTGSRVTHYNMERARKAKGKR